MNDSISRTAAIDALKEWLYDQSDERLIDEVLLDVPSTQPKIIHCRECVYCGDQQLGDGRYWCRKHCEYMHYCSSAERREDE